jgi:hypothetical protein
MTVTLVPAIKTDHIPGKESSHQSSKGNFPSPKKKVGMIRQQCPGVTGGRCFRQKCLHPLKKILPISIILENVPAFNAPDADMMKHSGGVQAS